MWCIIIASQSLLAASPVLYHCLLSRFHFFPISDLICCDDSQPLQMATAATFTSATVTGVPYSKSCQRLHAMRADLPLLHEWPIAVTRLHPIWSSLVTDWYTSWWNIRCILITNVLYALVSSAIPNSLTTISIYIGEWCCYRWMVTSSVDCPYWKLTDIFATPPPPSLPSLATSWASLLHSMPIPNNMSTHLVVACMIIHNEC